MIYSIINRCNEVIIFENSFGYHAFSITVGSSPVHLVRLPLSLVITAIRPFINSLAETHALDELTFIVVLVAESIQAPPMLLAVLPFPSVGVPSIHLEGPLAFLAIIHPQSCVLVTIIIQICSLPASQATFPGSFIAISICVLHSTLAILLIVRPIAVVLSIATLHQAFSPFKSVSKLSIVQNRPFCIFISHFPSAGWLIIFELTFENASVPVENLTLSCFFALLKLTLKVIFIFMNNFCFTVKQSTLPAPFDDDFRRDAYRIRSLTVPYVVFPFSLVLLACLGIVVSSESVLHALLEFATVFVLTRVDILTLLESLVIKVKVSGKCVSVGEPEADWLL